MYWDYQVDMQNVLYKWSYNANIFHCVLHTDTLNITIFFAATRCTFPVQPTSGSYYLSKTKDGEVTVYYSCQNSYTLVGNSERKCLYDGSWSGEDPTCERPSKSAKN